MLVFTGEQFVEQEREDDDGPMPVSTPRRERTGETLYGFQDHGGPNLRRVGNDEPCGGGRRVVRKRID
jgi:hypothetical protein